MKTTQLLHDLGQSLWLDNFAKAGVDVDALAAQLLDEVLGRSSNPGTSSWG